MKVIVQRWNLMRILRLVLGISILVQGIVAKDAMIIVLGVLFSGMTIANIGCCGTSGCTINRRSANKTQRIDYEDLDIKK